MSNIKIYTKRACAYCAQAKQLLQRKGIAYEELDVGAAPGIEMDLAAQTGFRTVPQIFVDGRFIGGFTDLAKLSALGELDYLIREKEATDSNQDDAAPHP